MISMNMDEQKVVNMRLSYMSPTRQQGQLVQGPPPDIAQSAEFNDYFQALTKQFRDEVDSLQQQLNSMQAELASVREQLKQISPEFSASESTTSTNVSTCGSSTAAEHWPSPVPVSALKDLPPCSSDILFTGDLPVWALCVRVHLRAAFAAGAPLDELRATLTLSVPKMARYFFNDSTRWTEKDAAAGFVTLIDDFIAAYAGSSEMDDLHLFIRFDELQFAWEKDHESNTRIALEAVARGLYPS